MPEKYRRLLFLTITIFCCSHVYGIFYKQLNIPNALTNSTIYHVVKDSKGFLWFCTSNGITKFDGKNFKNYTVFDGLGDNEIFNLLEDKIGRLWVCTNNGNPCFIFHDSVFNAGNNLLLNKLPVIRFINTIYSPEDSVVYIGYKYSDSILKVIGSNITWIIKDKELIGGVTCIFPCHDSLMIYCTDQLITLKNDSIIKRNYFDEQKGFLYYHAYYSNNKILFNDLFGIKIYENSNLTWELDESDLNALNSNFLYYDGNNNIFACTNKGLYVINTITGLRFKLFKNFKISCISRDIMGNYWMTTMNNGIYVINKYLYDMDLIYKISDCNAYFSNNRQLFIQKDDSIFYLNKQNNALEKIPIKFENNYEPRFINSEFLFYLDPKDYKTHYYNMIKKTIDSFKFIGDKEILSYDTNNIILISHKNLYDINIKKQKIVMTNSYSNVWIHLIAFDDINKLYFISNKKLYQYSTVTKHMTIIDSLIQMLLLACIVIVIIY